MDILHTHTVKPMGKCPFHTFAKKENRTANSRLTLHTIPAEFLEWLVSSRVRFLDGLANGQAMRYFSAHLPTMITWSKEEGQFPVNMTVKGIGLIPKEKYLQNYTKLFEQTAAVAASDWEKSFSERMEASKKLYSDINHFEPSLLGGLEIFEGSALKNLKQNSNASLLYVGMMNTETAMKYISFQVNGEVELIDKENPYYKYLLSSRKLFEFDKFHLYQSDYPVGYLIKVKEVRDKSPFTRSR